MFGGENFPTKHVSQVNIKQAAHMHIYKKILGFDKFQIRPLC